MAGVGLCCQDSGDRRGVQGRTVAGTHDRLLLIQIPCRAVASGPRALSAEHRAEHRDGRANPSCAANRPSEESPELSGERGRNGVPGVSPRSSAPVPCGWGALPRFHAPWIPSMWAEKLPSEGLGPWRTRVSAPVWPAGVLGPGLMPHGSQGGISRIPACAEHPRFRVLQSMSEASSFQSCHTCCWPSEGARETGDTGLRPGVGSAREDGQGRCKLLAAGGEPPAGTR